MRQSSAVAPERRIALTLEQCWHRVPGGTATAALRTIDGLRATTDLHLVGVSAWHRKPPAEAWRPPIGVRSLPLPRLPLYESWHRLRAPRVQRATGPVDVIHATGMAMPPHSAPIVVTLHDLAFLVEPRWFTRRGLTFFHQALELMRTDADLVLCSSQATRAAAADAGIDASRLRVVPLGVDAGATDDAAIARARRAHALDRPYILWTGTVEPRKNLAGLIGAFRLIEHERPDLDADLVLVGPRGWNEDLEWLVGSDHRRIKVLGFVSRPDLEALYGGASVVCQPSHLEGFGLPVLDAMAQGAAVVTSRGTSTEEVAGDAAVLVEPTSIEGIAHGLLTVLDDPSLASRLGAAGRERAAGYTWERTAALTAAAYDEVSR
jgi:glycosyltransferase involved in cell wall biosynthesis